MHERSEDGKFPFLLILLFIQFSLHRFSANKSVLKTSFQTRQGLLERVRVREKLHSSCIGDVGPSLGGVNTTWTEPGQCAHKVQVLIHIIQLRRNLHAESHFFSIQVFLSRFACIFSQVERRR
jgi:hypothetical protein